MKDKCPNCGTMVPMNNGYCICCYWEEGERPFRPWWMKERVWLFGLRTRWLTQKKHIKPPLPKVFQIIMDGIRKTGS